MIKEFRSAAKSISTKILLLLLVLTFALWGVEGMLMQSTGKVNVASVGDMNVSIIEYRNALAQETERYQQRFGNQFSAEIAKQLNLGANVLQNITDNKLLLLESKKLGIRVSDEEIAKNIVKNRQFFDDKGKFSKEFFQRFLKLSGISEKNYIEKLRGDMAVRILTNSIISAATAPDIVAKTLAEARGEKRKIDFYSIPTSSLKPISAASEEQLKEYYNEHIADFTSPEYRTISYISIDAEHAKKYAEILKKNQKEVLDIEAIYRERIAEFKKPERRTVEHLLYGSEEAASKAYKDMITGQSFEETSKNSNILNPETISLGTIEKSSLMLEAADKVFSLEKNKISEPIKTSFGWHIFRVKEIIPVSVASLEEARPQIEKELEHLANDNALMELSNKIEDTIAGGGTLNEAAKEFDLKVISLAAVDRNGLLIDGTAEKNLPKDEKFLDVAFKTDERTESSMIAGKGGINYILRVESITPERVRPLEEIKDKVNAAWSDAEKKKQLGEMAKKIAADFSVVAKRSQVIKDYSLSPTEIVISLQGENNKKIPNNSFAEIFTLPVNASSKEFAQENGGYAFTVVKEIIPAKFDEKDPKNQATLSDIHKEYQTAKQQELLEQYLRFLATKYTIMVNAEAIKASEESVQ